MSILRLNKQILIITITLFMAIIYAVPNLYPDQPTLILSEAIKPEPVNDLLEKSQMNYHWVDGTHIQFASVDEQLQARDLLKAAYPEINLSLNLEKSTPSWLSWFGASPMKLGLDLQGGIHFLLEVDTSHIEQSRDQNQKQAIQSILKEHKIRYQSIHQEGSQFSITPLSTEDRTPMIDVLAKTFPLANLQSASTDIVISFPASVDANTYCVNQTIQSLEKRINELGISEAAISRQGTKHISIDLPGIQDIQYAKKIIGKTATLRFQLVEDQPSGQTTIEDSNGNLIPLKPDIVLSGDSIAFASAKINQGTPVVEIQLDGHADQFYHATSKNVGKRLAVVYSEIQNDQLHERVISAPVIKQALGDNFVISGAGDYQEAKDLSLLLRSGALAAPIKFIEETTIGPSLGIDNINKGLLSLIVGSSIIFIFMGYYYRLFGLIANLALLLNIVLIVAILSIMGATLTLPGIAGIVLSVGMAVDANVLINERIREETQAKKPLREAVALGYEKALSAIVDANITTLLVTFVLFGLGAGAVKGFAVTTCMGILASVFSSVYFTQALTQLCIDWGILRTVNMSHDWFSNIPNIDFMKISRQAFIFSSIILLSSMLLVFSKGLNLGLDFTGGQQLTLQTAGDIAPETVRQALTELDITEAQVQTYGASDTFLIKIGSMTQPIKTLIASLEDKIAMSHVLHAEFIGPQVGSSMLKSSLLSVTAALVVTMLYVALRFEYRFALSAIVSLIHDPILILGVFAFTQIEFNLIALAAMLTILGYSINDTIVVYDRVRENFKTSLTTSTDTVINQAINQTLSRTVLTSCLTLIVVMALYLFGGQYLHGFSLSLAIGIIIGTYSSIYIAGSMAVKLGLKREDLIPPPSLGEIYEP